MLRKLFMRRLAALVAVASVFASSAAYGSKNVNTYGPATWAVGRVQEWKLTTNWMGYTMFAWVTNPSTEPPVPMTRYIITVPSPFPGGPIYTYIRHEHIFVTTFANAAAITGANTYGHTHTTGAYFWDNSTIVP